MERFSHHTQEQEVDQESKEAQAFLLERARIELEMLHDGKKPTEEEIAEHAARIKEREEEQARESEMVG